MNPLRKHLRWLLLVLLVLVPISAVLASLSLQNKTVDFDPAKAYQHVTAQMEFGARVPGSQAHEQTIKYISSELKKSGWSLEIQEVEALGHPVRNIIAKRGNGADWIILGAHYDSRLISDMDMDPELQTFPVPGANDGASGVAVLLEIARVLPKSSDQEVWIVLFDAEDQGNIPGWDWILGSRAFVKSLQGKPDAVVVIDMIGDSNLNVYREEGSDTQLTSEIWNVAASLGYGNSIINEVKHNILDDHIPFLEVGIPAIDMIDFDYPFWHTSDDTLDKVSPDSLEIVGKTLLTWLRTR